MRRFRNFVAPAFAAATALLVTGCIDSEEKIVLNPDGSGKALVKIKVTGGGITLNDEEPDPDQVARDTAAGLIAGAEGVDAWTKVKYGIDKEGRSEFSGVAYFADITRFSIGSMQGGGTSISGGEAAWKMERQGDVITLTYLPMGAGDETEEAGDPPADIEAAIKKERMEFRPPQTMMAGFLSEMKTSVAVKLPGQIQGTRIFDKKAENVAATSFTAAQLVEGMETVMGDDALMRKLAREGWLGDDGDLPPEVMERAFGAESFEIVFKAGKAQFDYAAEVAEAKENLSEDLKKMLEEAEAGGTAGGSFSFSSEDEEDEPAGDPDPGFEAFAKKHFDSLAPGLETKDGKAIRATVNSTGKMKNDGREGSAEINVTFSDGATSEDVDVTVYFSRRDEQWEANGFSAGGLPDFLGEGLDKLGVVSDWVKKE